MSNVTLNKRSTNYAVALDDVDYGDCFMYESNLYMKIDLCQIDEALQGCSVDFDNGGYEEDKVAAIALNDGDLFVFGCGVAVMPLEDVTINY